MPGRARAREHVSAIAAPGLLSLAGLGEERSMALSSMAGLVVMLAAVPNGAPVDDDVAEGAPPVTTTAVAAPPAAVPAGFYRDGLGRLMQVSFDLGRRVWLGVAYAPRRRPTGEAEIAPASFDFGATYDDLSADGMTRHRFRIFDGEVRLHPFGLDLTAFRYDLSHRYDHPLVRVTTFLGQPERHDLFLNVGLFMEALRFEVAPRGIDGEDAITVGNVQATLDLWQSADLRSYLRLRTGPGVEMRLGQWGDQTRFVGFFPQATLEGSFIVGRRALQQLTFWLRGDFLRSLTWTARPLPGDWLADGQVAYEAILLAINDQPVSLRLAAQVGVRDDARAPPATDSAVTAVSLLAPGWEWKGTAGIRVSFFSPPLARRASAPQ
jgi:hypothetical protein